MQTNKNGRTVTITAEYSVFVFGVLTNGLKLSSTIYCQLRTESFYLQDRNHPTNFGVLCLKKLSPSLFSSYITSVSSISTELFAVTIYVITSLDEGDPYCLI